MLSSQPQRRVGTSPGRPAGQVQRTQPSKISSPLKAGLAAGLAAVQSQAGGLTAQQSQYDWEKEIESLDQKEMELHQTQMKLIREQMHNLIRELAGLREEVGELRLQREGDKMEVQAFHEELHRDKEETQVEIMALIEALQEDNKGHTSKLDEVAALVGDGMLEDRVRDTHADLENRLAMLHQAHGEASQQHANELSSLRNLHDAHSARFDEHAREAQAHHATVPERLAYLEQILGDSADEHSGKLDDALAKVNHLHGRITDLGKSHDSLAKDKEEKHASMQERVDYIESTLGDSADKHAKEVEALKAAHEKHANAMTKQGKVLDDHKGAVQGHHATMQQRIDEIEEMLGMHADKHGDNLAEHASKFDEMHNRLCSVERFGSVLDELKKSHGGLSKQKDELLGHHGTLRERIERVEQAFDDTLGAHGNHLQELRDAHDKHVGAMSKHQKDVEGLRAEKQAFARRLSGMEDLHNENAEKHAAGLSDVDAKAQAVLDRLAGVEKHGSNISNLQRSHDALTAKKEELESSHATMGERVAYLEKMLGDSVDKHAKELKALRDSHSKHGNDLEGLRGLQSKHSTVDQRLDYLEQSLGDSADKHGEELAELKRSHDALHGRLSAAENHGVALNELRKSHGGLAVQKSQLEAHHASLKERVDYLEQILNDSADQHAEKLDAAHAKLTDMHGRVSACERLGPALLELKRGHSELQDSRRAFDSDAASTKERLDSLETLFGDSTNRHAKELKNLRASHDKHAGMLTKHASSLDGFAAHQEHHATLPERMTYIEEQLGDSADKHAAEVAALHKKVAQEQAAREKHHGSMKDLVAREQEERGQHHASLNERVDYLESMIGDTADKHARELAQLASGHQKLQGELKARGDGHLSVGDRISRLEKGLSEAAERQSRDNKMTHARLDSFNSRFSVVKEAWGQETPRQG